MTKYRGIALASAVALASLSFSSAMATPFPATGTATGTVTLKQSITVNCNFSAKTRVVGSDVEIYDVKFTAGNVLCGGVVKPNTLTWVAVGAAGHTTSPATITINNVGASTVLGGSCLGNISATLTDVGSIHNVAISNQLVPGTPSNCTVVAGNINIS